MIGKLCNCLELYYMLVHIWVRYSSLLYGPVWGRYHSGVWVMVLSTGHIRPLLGTECGNSSVVRVSNQIRRVYRIHFTLHTLQNESTGTSSSQTTFAVQHPLSTSVLFSSHSQTFNKVHRAEGCYQQGKVVYW